MDGSNRPNPQATPAPAAAAAAAPMTSAEDEAIKKNTDCVYFLASPLTCKKGSECEYRHSDNARLNPRDCWYWMHANCLNPKCAFRHPPLDGLLGPQVTNNVESYMPPVQSVVPAAQVPYISNKPGGVPCIFFQKAMCLKGDRCPFLHAPNSLTNKPPQKQGVAPTTEVSSKKTFGGLEKCTEKKNTPQINILKTGEQPPAPAKPVAKEGPGQAKNHFLVNKNMAPNSIIDNESLKYKPTSVPPNGYPVSRSSQMQHQHDFDDHGNMHNKDEEISREASPGFDVLVDGDSDYYPVEDQYGPGDHERSEYDIDPSADYSIGDLDRDMYRDAHGYDSYDRLPSHYAWEQRGASSERKSGRSAHPERRRYGNTDSSDQVDESDLRHRLSKQRRGNSLRSVISHEYTSERHVEEQSYRGSRRETNHLSSHESSLSSRLRGRIKIPGGSSSPTDVTDIRSDREMDRGRDRGRLSHTRPQLSSHQGRLQDRIKGRLQEDLNYNAGRNSRVPPLRGDMLSENNSNFAGPKSLAELKGKKGIEGNGQQSLGKRKLQKYDDLQQCGGDLSFEGPKPLKEILKRKKFGDSEDNNQQETEPSSLHKNEADLAAAQREDLQPPSGNNNSDLHRNKSVTDLEVEDGMIADEGAEYHDGEGYDQQDGDYNYEQVDGEDVNIDEAENGDADEEYLDDDDDDADDFAKKMAVAFS